MLTLSPAEVLLGEGGFRGGRPEANGALQKRAGPCVNEVVTGAFCLLSIFTAERGIAWSALSIDCSG